MSMGEKLHMSLSRADAGEDIDDANRGPGIWLIVWMEHSYV